MSEKTIEQQIQDAGLTAPRVTPADIEAEIAHEHYFTALEGVAGARYVRRDDASLFDIGGAVNLSLLTFCVLVLRNGFTVTGESACASPANFNAEIGRKIAREHAVEKIWPLLGFRLRDALASPAWEDGGHIAATAVEG